MPPEWMWPIDELIAEHFERVREERDEKYGTTSDKDDGDTKVPLMQNELSKGRR